MKNLLFSCLFFFPFLSSLTFGQSTAMDFTHEECGGPSHHLFSELDAGHVVILDFIMLNCAPCIVGTNALESITEPYELSHPGRVHTYSFGFLNSYTCDQLLAWKSNNEYAHPVFNNGEEQVSYYGGMGMPTIVVVGTNEHKVYFKSIGYTSSIDDKIRGAIDSALLYNPTGVGEKLLPGAFRIYPTIFTDRLIVETGDDFTEGEIILYDSFGREVLSFNFTGGGQVSLPVHELSKGIYIARFRNEQGLSGGTRLIRQ